MDNCLFYYSMYLCLCIQRSVASGRREVTEDLNLDEIIKSAKFVVLLRHNIGCLAGKIR